jgi:hypothetical protein
MRLGIASETLPMKGVDKPKVIASVNKVLLRLMFGGIVFNSVSPEDVGFGLLYTPATI